MDIIQLTPQGKVKKTLTQEELIEHAKNSTTAKKEIAKQEIAIAKDDNERINAIIKFLGV